MRVWLWSLQVHTCDTEMNTKWTMLNCGTSMVQTLLYSRCTETTVPCIRYGSETQTIVQTVMHTDCTKNYRTMKPVHAYDTVVMHQQWARNAITKLIRVQQKLNHQITNNDKTAHSWPLTSNERESVEEREAKKEEGRKGSLRKEVINVESAKQTNVTQQWMWAGLRWIVVPAWYRKVP